MIVTIWWLCFATASGLCVGSFLNVIIYRVPRDLRDVSHTEFGRHLSRAFVVTAEQDVARGSQARPAPDRVALNRPDVAAEGLRHREESQHRVHRVAGRAT